MSSTIKTSMIILNWHNCSMQKNEIVILSLNYAKVYYDDTYTYILLNLQYIKISFK